MQRAVYTRGFPETFTKENLSEVFNAFGKVRKIKLVSEEKKLYAIIFFYFKADAKKAIENLHKKTIDGITWYANFREKLDDYDGRKRNRISQERGASIILRDFPESFTEITAREIFSKHGVIKNLAIKPPYCYITFETKEQAEEAIRNEKLLIFEGKRVFVAIQKDKDSLARMIQNKKSNKSYQKINNQRYYYNGYSDSDL